MDRDIDLEWSWLAAPYAACALAMLAVFVTTALIRGDRVLRLGMIGAAAAALPWAITSAIAACTHDAVFATRLLRLGTGPVGLVGPDLLIVLLGVSGQLERYRWLARVAAALGGLLLAACWLTEWTVPGVRELPSGVFYITPGPLTGVHMAQLGLWLAAGIVIARRATPSAERRRLVRLLLLVLALGAVGASDALLLYDVWGVYPIAWLPSGGGCLVVMYLVVRTDILRPRGFDKSSLIELVGFVVAIAAIAGMAFATPGAAALPFAALGSVVWVITTASAWGLARARRPVRRGGNADDLVARLAELADAGAIADRVGEAWRTAVGILPVATWIAADDDPSLLRPLYGGTPWRLDPEAVKWLAERADPLAMADVGTMRLGPLRGPIEALGSAHGATLIVPLVDRGALVGIIEAMYDRALREGERGLVAASARAAARQLTFVRLSREAAREGELAREVEVAEAMRLASSATRDTEYGDWTVAAAYRSAKRTTGAAWSAALLDDGRLALLVTEAGGHGVAAALASPALTGAFAAATTGPGVTLEELLVSLRASADGVYRGGEPVAAFVALLSRERVEWASAGHPGAHVVGESRPVALGGGGASLGASLAVATRGTVSFSPDSMLVVASASLRHDDARWERTLRELAPAGPKLATLAVERAGSRDEDLLAVIIRLET